jgi:hypothetical protein
LCALSLSLLTSRGAWAETPAPDYFGAAQDPGAITLRVTNARTTRSKVITAALVGAGLAVTAVGVYYHLDSRSAASEVSADHLTGQAWTHALADAQDRADRSGTRAIVSYVVGGALVTSAVVYLWATRPDSREVTIAPRRAAPVIAPTSSGLVVGGSWTF